MNGVRWPYDANRNLHSERVGPSPRAQAAVANLGLWTPTSGSAGASERMPGAATEGETEDERNQLPTSRVAPLSTAAKLLPFLFFALRMLSVIPATTGMAVNLYHFYDPPTSLSLSNGRTRTNPNSRVEYGIAILWTIGTANQCLSLTTGLLHRWRIYYSTIPTLIRLLALQFAICWPLTHLTLTIFDHNRRPLVCWAIIGTTTCISKAVQLWVTSNLRPAKKDEVWSVRGLAGWLLGEDAYDDAVDGRRESYEKANLKKRKWNWARVLKRCVAPPCVIYVVMAWALLLKREFETD